MGRSIESFCSFKALCMLCLCLRAVATGIELSGGTSGYTDLFRELTVVFDSHEPGCSEATGPVDAYSWRGVGYGSNVNIMILPWLDAIVHGRRDLALITGNSLHPDEEPDNLFELVECLQTSNGVEIDGFSCLFEPMPHVCVFRTQQDYEDFLMERDVSTARRENVLSHMAVKHHKAKIGGIDQQLQGSGIDILAAKAVILGYLHSHWQPWVKRDIQTILDERTIATVRDGPYIGIHVRRGDKLKREAKAHDVKEYLNKAYLYIQDSVTATTVSVNDIRGIWVSSDDKQVVSDVKESFADFFPSVELERIVWISDRAVATTNASSSQPLPTKAHFMNYEIYVDFFAELEMLSQASVFVGTFSSNVARIVVLLRELRDMERGSSLSVDVQDWFPDRHLFVSG